MMAISDAAPPHLRHPAPTTRYDPEPNVEGVERWLSLAGGGALALWGVRRGDALGAAAGVLGAALVARGATGRDPAKRLVTARPEERAIARARGWSTAALAARTVTINRSRDELYALWRDFANLPRFLKNVESIEVLDETRSRWTVKSPVADTLSWEAVITNEEPGRRIAWESAPGADVKNAGWVEFADAPKERGTILRALIAYEPPFGQAGKLAAKALRREPAIQARRDLRRFKQWVETGEVATSTPGAAAPRCGL